MISLGEDEVWPLIVEILSIERLLAGGFV